MGPALKAARTEKDELESLRLEVEALRASLQATKQRVKALEAVVQARQSRRRRGGVSGSTARRFPAFPGAEPSVPEGVHRRDPSASRN